MAGTAQRFKRKSLGAYYSPRNVVAALVSWAVRRESDFLLDPACGDGRFLSLHKRSMGIDCDTSAVSTAATAAPNARIVAGNFFEWVIRTRQRFECAVGNPPFIRYQRFAGQTRAAALNVCAELGVRFSSLTSSWAPFLAAATRVLVPGGRMAFIVPAEIGHAPYAVPLIEFLVSRFSEVRIVAVREKLFPELSEDAWLLLASGYGAATNCIALTVQDRFDARTIGSGHAEAIALSDWRRWHHRLRAFLVPPRTRQIYSNLLDSPDVVRLGKLAQTSIGYVTGANDFFHLRPSEAKRRGIPNRFLMPTVRNSRYLSSEGVTRRVVDSWIRRDDPMLLLRLNQKDVLPKPVLDYLTSEAAIEVQNAYKCRARSPWYVVPDVRIPDAFLSYMSGDVPSLVANGAGCCCTNSVHAVVLRDKKVGLRRLLNYWDHPLVHFSAEIEGHPLGGGMLKLEPREASRIAIPSSATTLAGTELCDFKDATALLRRWRHYG